MKNMIKTLINGLKVWIIQAMPKKLSELLNDLKLSDFENDIPQTWIVTVTEDDEENLKADKTFKEIKKAIDDGLNVEVEYENERYILGYCGLRVYSFNCSSFDCLSALRIYDNGYVEYSELNIARESDLIDKMSRNYPSGTGTFVMNGKSDGARGTNSTAIGEGTFSEYKNQFAEGMYNKYSNYLYDEEIGKGDTIESVSSAKFYYGYEYSFSKTNGQYTIANQKSDYIYNIPVGAYFKASSASNIYMYLRTEDAELTVPTSNKYVLKNVIVYHGMRTYECKKYAHIVGNGTSDTERSNAHTLDWQGNAEYAGDVKANACGGEEPISLVETWKKAKEVDSIIEQVEGDTFTWDGDLAGKEITGNGLLVKVSDVTPTLEELQKGVVIGVQGGTADITSEIVSTNNGNLISVGLYVAVALEDGTYSGNAYTKGLYVLLDPLVTMIKITDYTGFKTTKIKEELLSSTAPLVVEFTTSDGTTFTSDKTFAEVQNAIISGRTVYAGINEMIFPLGSFVHDAVIYFTAQMIEEGVLITVQIVLSSDNSATMSQVG